MKRIGLFGSRRGGDPIADENVWKVEVDTGEAQQNVENLEEGVKSLQEILEGAGGAGNEMGDGLVHSAGDGMAALDRLGGAAGSAGQAVSAAGNAAAAAGGRINDAMDNASSASAGLETSFDDTGGAAGSLGDTAEDSGRRAKNAFRNAAAASDSLGASFAKNFSKASQDGKTFSSSIRTGIVGAFDTAKKRVATFVGDTVAGTKKIGSAFLHPIQTIKGKFTGAMKDASKGVDQVGDEANGAEKDLDGMGKAGEGAGGKIKSGLGGALKVLAAVAAAAMAVTGIAKFVSAAMDASKAAENVSYSFNQTFGDNAPDVEGWADNFAGAVHRSGTEVKSFLTSNRQLYESMGVTGEAANDLSKMTTSLAYDLGNFAGIEDAEALSKLQDAIGGNAAALSDFGIRLDDAALKQTALGMGLGGNLDAMDEATLAQVRFNSILEQTGDLQGNASTSLGGLTGGMKAVKATWTDFLEKAGAKLAPTFDKIFGAVLDAWPKVEPALLSFVDLLAGGFEQAAPILADFATNLLPQLLGLASELLPMLMEVGGELLPIISQVLGTVVSAIGPLMPLISTLIKTLLPPLAQLFGTLVETLLPPLASLLGALAPVIDALSPVLDVVAIGIGFVADAIATLIGWLTKGIEKVGEFAQGLKDSAVGKFVSGIGEGISSIGDTLFGGNAKGTDNFEGGWTRIHEAGPELIHNKQESGIAFLPRGSAVIPAGKTNEILSEDREGTVINITNLLPSSDDHTRILPGEDRAPQPQPGWVPVLLEGNPAFQEENGPEADGDGDSNPPPPPPPPQNPPPEDEPGASPSAPASGGETVARKIIEWNINVTSSDGSVHPEVLRQFEQLARKVYREEEDDKLNGLSIQEGYA